MKTLMAIITGIVGFQSLSYAEAVSEGKAVIVLRQSDYEHLLRRRPRPDPRVLDRLRRENEAWLEKRELELKELDLKLAACNAEIVRENRERQEKVEQYAREWRREREAEYQRDIDRINCYSRRQRRRGRDSRRRVYVAMNCR